FELALVDPEDDDIDRHPRRHAGAADASARAGARMPRVGATQRRVARRHLRSALGDDVSRVTHLLNCNMRSSDAAAATRTSSSISSLNCMFSSELTTLSSVIIFMNWQSLHAL